MKRNLGISKEEILIIRFIIPFIEVLWSNLNSVTKNQGTRGLLTDKLNTYKRTIR